MPVRDFDDTLPADSAQPTPAASPTPQQSPELVGRYRLERVLGEGGMGVVHAAYDPELDRPVALKLLHETRNQGRLLREAQAMVRLRHPNVVTVHDVGVSGDRVFVTMELIEGKTLRAWLHAAPRTWREIITMYIAAGRGLAAAHDAGIIHRDFKPDNVLIGTDGSVRVADFGLARAGELPSSSSSGSMASSSSSSTISGDRLVQTAEGSVLGTPAYMAPEQHEAGTVGPPADQFAFAAALWEALAGERPFSGGDVAKLAVAKREQRINPPPRRVP